MIILSKHLEIICVLIHSCFTCPFESQFTSQPSQTDNSNTSLLCCCSLTNPEPETTMTTLTWPRKQVLTLTTTLDVVQSMIWMSVILLPNVCVNVLRHCVFILCQVRRPLQMQESNILTLNKPVWDMSTVSFK